MLEPVARQVAEDGTELVLYRGDGAVQIRAGGRELMSSRAHGSEAALARLACAALGERPAPALLIGGLGLGYTLRAALDALGPLATVEVVEVFAAVVEWVRGPLGSLSGRPLSDPRVRVRAGDVGAVLERSAGRYDAVVLDVDNGPGVLALPANRRLYTAPGLRRTARALKPDGVIAVWLPGPDPGFARRLERSGLRAELHPVAASPAPRAPQHVVALARASAPGAEPAAPPL